MTHHDTSTLAPEPRHPAAVRPARALTSGTWIAALITLGLNDHVLKHASVLPSVVTDVAGMFVAPALLAALCRARSLVGVRRAYVAVFSVFAAINLVPAASEAWTALLGSIGVPSVNVCDPTDVPFAFLAILLSWRALTPTMCPSSQLPRLPAGRVVELLSLSLGVTLCVATQPKERIEVPLAPVPEFSPPRPEEGAVVIVTGEAVSGYAELRCTDGARTELPFVVEEPLRRHSWVIFAPRPTEGVECKLKVLGARGSYGPIDRGSELLWCDASPAHELRCRPRDYAEFPPAAAEPAAAEPAQVAP